MSEKTMEYKFTIRAVFRFCICGLIPSCVLEGTTLYFIYADKEMPTVKVDTAKFHLKDFIKAVQKIRIIWIHIDDSPIGMVQAWLEDTFQSKREPM